MELYFAHEFEVLGEVKIHELKPGGEDILVVEENKVRVLYVTRALSRVLYVTRALSRVSQLVSSSIPGK